MVSLRSNVWSLSLEASSVIALRALKVAAGGRAAESEARRMVSEKIEAGLALQTLALTGWSVLATGDHRVAAAG
jgi:hypothetical protein